MNDREQFEAWHAEKFGWLNAEIWPGNGSYDDRFVQDRWEVWSAARATPAQPVPDEWMEAQRICDLPAVDEAIRGFVEDQTGDNAVCVVREVMRAIATPSPASDVSVPSPSSVGAAIRKLEPDHEWPAGERHAFKLALSEAAELAERVQGQQVEPQQFGAVHTIVMDGHQLKDALDLIAPDRDEDPDQLDEWLTFGVVKHKDDDGKVSTGLCCWNDDTDGVYPLHDEPAPAAVDKDNCPTCGHPWLDHEFAVPAPYCPAPSIAQDGQKSEAHDGAL